MEKCIYQGRVLYAYQVLKDFNFEQEIRSCRQLTCCDCGEPVYFRHGKQRAECFAHFKRKECKYSEYCKMQTDIFKYAQRELYGHLFRIAQQRGLTLEEDVIIIPDHYTAFSLTGESIKFAIDIIDTAVTSSTLENRNKLYERKGYRYLQITVDKDAETKPFSEREMAYFPVKYALNKSRNHTAIVIDSENKNWFIYILDNMDKSEQSAYSYKYEEWYGHDAFAMQVALESLDIGKKGFLVASTNAAFDQFCRKRREQKARWLREEEQRRERERKNAEIARKQAEEARKKAEIIRLENERRQKEAEERKKREAEAQRAAKEAAILQAAREAEQRKQHRIANEKAEKIHIHQTTGCYVGSRISGRYERFSLEELTASKPRNWLRTYTKADFECVISELKEYSSSAVKKMFAKLCYITPAEKEILIQLLTEMEENDPESVRVIRYLMQRVGRY